MMRHFAKGGESTVPTVELADRHQIQGRDQQPNPGGEVVRVREGIVQVDLECARKKTKKQWIIEDYSATATAGSFAGNQRHVLKRQHCGKSDWNNHDEPCQRSGEPNVEQGPTRGDGRLHARSGLPAGTPKTLVPASVSPDG